MPLIADDQKGQQPPLAFLKLKTVPGGVPKDRVTYRCASGGGLAMIFPGEILGCSSDT